VAAEIGTSHPFYPNLAGMTATAGMVAPSRARAYRDPRWVWSVPIGVFVLIGASPIFGFTLVAAAVLALATVVVLSRYPGASLVALVWFLPFQIPLFSFLYHHGVPAGLVRPFGALKEALGIAILLAAARAIRAERRRLDALDKLVLAFVAALVLYLVAPMVVSTAGLYSESFTTRLLGFRVNAGFLLLMFAVRHAPIDARWRRRFMASVLAVAAVFAGFALYQYASPGSFTDFIFDPLGIPYYHLEVLEESSDSVVQLVRWTLARPVRVGSLFVGPFEFADFMLIPAGLLLARLARRGARAIDVALLIAVGAAVFASQTRANLLGLGVMALLAMTPQRQRSFANQLRVIAIVLLAVAAFVPNFASSRLGGADEAGESTEGHVDELRGGMELIQDYPLGLGLGRAPSVAVREENAPVVISDNSILQVGNELGVVMMVFFVVVLAVLLRGLLRRTRRDPANEFAAGGLLVIVGLLVSGQFHHVFQFFPVAWLAWAIAGLGLSPGRSDTVEDDVQVGDGDQPESAAFS
jgi:hypothetical protein